MPNITRQFTTAELDEIGVPFDLPEELEVSDRHLSSRRWVEVRELLFRHDGHVWRVTYQRGLTEYQEGTDPWCGESTVTATAMEQREVTVTQWLPVEAPASEPSAE